MQSETELIKIGTGYLDTLEYKKAIDFYTRAIEINSSNSQTFELRAIAWFKIFDIDKALSDTSTAIELDKKNHNAWFNKGEILKYRKEYSEAELCYREADKIYPDNLFYITGLIETTYKQKKYKETIGYCNQILKESPIDFIALNFRGLAFSKQLDYEAAIKDYLKIADIKKPNATIYNNLGFWYSKMGKLKKAYNNLSVALQLNQTHPYALDNLGFVEYLNGNYEKALKLIERSLEIAPSNSYAYKNRALVYLKINQRELALNDLQMARSLDYLEDYGNEVEELLKKEFNL
ncbi:MAG TPA: tetratricopeptide repeat protein [Puia sp.]|jgi:tetratricopeptide (TPR) repeat protein|nr:tetratricopeptide repeat protein [Puia sp.]